MTPGGKDPGIQARRYYEALVCQVYGIVLVSEDDRVELVNQTFCDMFGLARPPEELVGLSADEFLTLVKPAYADPAGTLARIKRLVAVGVTHVGDEIAMQDGRTFLVDFSPIFIDGKRSGRLWQHRDITERRRAEERMRLLTTAMEQSHESYVITDREGTILYVNPSFARVTGYSSEEAVGQNPRFLKSGVHVEEFYRDLWDTILAGRVWAGRITNRRKNGTTFVEHTVISPVFKEDGAIDAFVAARRDVTQELEYESRLEHAKSLETIGMVAAGMAHEVRNPLFAISTVAAALEKNYGDREELKPYVDHIQEHVRRLSELINDLLVLGKPVSRELFVPCDLVEIVDMTIGLVGAHPADEEARVRMEGEEGSLPVMGQREKLALVLVNLVQNALSFSPPGKPVIMRLSRDGAWGVIEVVDEGPGIEPEFLPRLFQPFATRRIGGTGLGLALVRKLVDGHGGSVGARNNDPGGPGATFTVRLPLTDAK